MALQVHNPLGSAPAVKFVAITKSDTVDIPGGPCRGIYVGGGAGTLVAVDSEGNVVTFTGIVTGSILPIQAKRVNSTTTDATDMVALF